MTRFQNKIPQTGSEKTNAHMEAITEEIVIATEARPANTSATCTGGDRDGWRKYLAEARSKTLKRRLMEMNSHNNYKRLSGRLATTIATLVCVLLFAVCTSAATYIVNSNDDIDDGVCNVSHCSLREAINAANDNVGSDFVVFDINTSNIPSRVATIVLTDALPVITGTVTIDGYSQRSCANIPAPCSRQNTVAVGNDAVLLVELNGAAIADSAANGLVINAPGCLVRGLVINRFPADGMVINSSASGTVIAGNWIGLNASGAFHQPNLGDGIFIHNASNITIGGTTPATRNVISGNDIAGTGVYISGSAASGNKIQGNYIGTACKGEYPAGNGYGIRLGSQVHGTTIGGAVAGAGNVISGNNGSGIYIDNAYNNQIQGNYIGVDALGDSHLPNGEEGIRILNNSITNTIGGTTAAARNIISGNGSVGIQIENSSNDLIEGNFIGTNAAGDSGIPNEGEGIRILGNSQSNKIGDSVAGAGNVISRNKLEGISIEGNISGTFVLRNFIGTNANGTGALPNDRDGIYIRDAHNNFIGSTIPNSGNVIAYNGVSSSYHGVNVYGDTAVGNAIRGNSIHDHNGKGIALNGLGAPPNDLDDVDTGQNNLQNSPVVSTAVNSNGATTITGTLNSEADKDYRLEFFANAQCGETGYGEGQTYLGATGVTTSGHNATFSVSFPGIGIGQVVTATATDPNGNTSEFSQCKQVTAPVQAGSLAFSAAAYSIGEAGPLATITVKRTGGSDGAVSVQYATVAGGTATPGFDYTAASGTLNWAAGNAADKTFTVAIVDDSLNEPNETINLALSNPGGGAALANPSTATLTIVDNDPQPNVSISDVSLAEGNSGVTSFFFNVTLSEASGQTVTVDYATVAGGTATLGNDYQPASGTLTFVPGELNKPVTVLVNGDPEIESDETFFVNLSNPANGSIAKGQGLGRIVNDESVAPPTVQFSQASYSIQEDLGAITITVTRTGDTSGAAAVDYATVDGTATQKSDYEIAAGSLSFAPGETSKTLSLLLNEDIHVEGNEAFTVALSNASGASLGQQSTTTVMISDDVPETLTNPIDDAQSFVYMHYHDFLNREPDPAGLAFWTNEINSCSNDQQCIDAKRINVSAAFFLSIEFQQTGFLLQLMQKESFGSLPKYAEFMRDLQEIGNGVVVNAPGWQQKLADNQQRFAQKWVNRPVFKATYDGLSDAAYVNTLYANAGIVPPQAEQAALVARLDNASETRAGVLLEIATNPAFREQEQNPAFVMMEYFGFLRRDPNAAPDSDLSGYLFWLNKLNNFNGNYVNAEMVKAFITSFEYRQRFAQ